MKDILSCVESIFSSNYRDPAMFDSWYRVYVCIHHALCVYGVWCIPFYMFCVLTYWRIRIRSVDVVTVTVRRLLRN